MDLICSALMMATLATKQHLQKVSSSTYLSLSLALSLSLSLSLSLFLSLSVCLIVLFLIAWLPSRNHTEGLAPDLLLGYKRERIRFWPTQIVPWLSVSIPFLLLPFLKKLVIPTPKPLHNHHFFITYHRKQRAQYSAYKPHSCF